MFVSYEVSVELIRTLRGVLVVMKEHDGDLADQMRRAASSITLNLGEGAGCTAGRRRQHYEIAHGSAKEVKACLDVGEAWGWLDASGVRAIMDRLLALLWGLTKGKWIKTKAGVPVASAAVATA
jgi:four helix bundle protein